MNRLCQSLCLLLIASSTPATAVIVNVQYTGVVDSGRDGQQGTMTYHDLAGLKILARYRYDTADISSSNNYSFGNAITVSGSAYVHVPGRSIGRQPINIFSNESHAIPQGSAIGFDQVVFDASGNNFRVYADVSTLPGRIFHDTNLDIDVDYYTLPTDAYMNYSNLLAYGPHFYVQGHVTRVQITTGNIPEPETWALMLAGFSLIGSALRRRRTNEHRGAKRRVSGANGMPFLLLR